MVHGLQQAALKLHLVRRHRWHHGRRWNRGLQILLRATHQPKNERKIKEKEAIRMEYFHFVHEEIKSSLIIVVVVADLFISVF